MRHTSPRGLRYHPGKHPPLPSRVPSYFFLPPFKLQIVDARTRRDPHNKVLWGRLADACVKTLITVGPMLRREYHAANPSSAWGRGRAGGGGSGGGGKGGATAPPPRSTCFTIIGMDLMVDDELAPWIIEINHLPSFRSAVAGFGLREEGRYCTRSRSCGRGGGCHYGWSNIRVC